MFNLKDCLHLLRVNQWYKNVVIFISITFSLNLFDIELLSLTFVGFFVLCFVSSSSYIINDILDIDKDKYHPEKKNRPLVSGRIKKSTALFISVIMFVFSVLIAYFLSFLFLLTVIFLFIFLQVYNFYVRGIAFLDIILISINFVMRAISGTFIVNSPVSFWVILSTFFISLFLVSAKRSVEISLKNVKKYRPSFNKADKKVLEFLSVMSATCVFVFFSIYCILTGVPKLLLSFPVALYITLIFIRDFYKEPKKIRNPERFIFDKKIFFAIIIWFIVVILTFYRFI